MEIENIKREEFGASVCILWLNSINSYKKLNSVKYCYEWDYNRFRSNNSPLPKKLKEYLITLQKREG